MSYCFYTSSHVAVQLSLDITIFTANQTGNKAPYRTARRRTRRGANGRIRKRLHANYSVEDGVENGIK